MKRIGAYLWAFMLAIGACVNPIAEPEPEKDGNTYPEGAKVTVSFTVAGEGIAPTKAQALGEDQPLTSLHLAVFGSSGYLKEYVEAIPSGEPIGTYTFPDPDDPDTQTTVPLYSFTADLTLTDSKRIIHFLGNGPSTLSFGYVDAILPKELSFSGERAYWQMMRINGIHAKQSTSAYKDQNGVDVEVGDYIDAAGNKITNGQGYVVADATQDEFQEVALVRNWAKMVLQADTNNGNNPYFEPISYAVVHVPDRGTLAPHSSATGGFIENYQKKTYLDIVNLGYPANLPPKTAIDETIPSINDFKYWDPEEPTHGNPETELVDGGWKNGVAPVHPKGAVYMYERPVPSDQLPPTFLLIYGKYLPEDTSDPNYGKKCFYKVDLMTDRKYYPVYRNFQYRILIHSILSFGHASPEAAAASAGSADVSADINARHLPDISDGRRRLAIQPWMARTFTSAQKNNEELSVYFDKDISTEGWDETPGSVTLELLPMKNSSIDPVVLDYEIDESPDESGFRKIRFTTSGPSDNIRSQTLRVIGTSSDESIYRDIVITIQNIQYMRVSCSDKRIKSEKGTPVSIYIDIPDGLAESMFPLKFLIEPEALTLSPHNDNLPVEYGTSISGSGKNSFHFIKSLTWDEYRNLPAELDDSDKAWRRMTCHFISNRDVSSTAIYVTNKTYFYDADTQLGNYSDKSFFDLRFLEPIKKDVDEQELTLNFDVARGDNDELPEVEVFIDGLKPDEEREGLPLPDGFTKFSDNGYRFTPTSSNVRLPFIITDSSGEVYVQLEAEDYESKSVGTHHFTLFNGIGFFDGHATSILSGWSNVVYGKVNKDNNKNVLFGYYDDPDALNASISLLNLKSLTVQGINSFPWTPDGPRSLEGANNYHELEFKTNNDKLQNPASFTLSAPGYLEVPVSADRFNGNIFTVSNTSLNQAVMNGNTYTVSMDKSSPHQATVTFSEEFTVDGKGVWLGKGQTGTITITNDKLSVFRFFYIQFNVGEGTYNQQIHRLFPKMDSVTLPDDEKFIKYPGSNDQCVWLRPNKTDEATITLTANEDYPVKITGIVLKTFRQN
jgi:hypothetical protein